MKPIVLFDVNVGSENMGDAIIMHYCNRYLREIFPKEFFFSIPTHDYIGKQFKKVYLNADIKIVCGTNLISSDMKDKEYKQWFLDSKDRKYLRDVILMGVGWQRYNDTISTYSSKLLRNILSKDNFLLSVRDKYTQDKLESIGFTNVINTGCPTMWGLTEQFCSEIPIRKEEEVITTVTNYNRDYENDRYMLELLKKMYKKVYIWIQSYYDIDYLREICNLNDFELIPPSLEMYTDILQKNIDYVGTRLHAGIHALNKKCRTIVISIDNRAEEISRDTGLFTIQRQSIKKVLEQKIHEELPCNIIIPTERINMWKNQFGVNRGI